MLRVYDEMIEYLFEMFPQMSLRLIFYILCLGKEGKPTRLSTYFVSKECTICEIVRKPVCVILVESVLSKTKIV